MNDITAGTSNLNNTGFQLLMLKPHATVTKHSTREELVTFQSIYAFFPK